MRAGSVVLALCVLTLCGGCYSKGTANTRVGAPCTTRGDCESLCWEGYCTLACEHDEECPDKMICIRPGLCAFSCVGQRECGGWKCSQRLWQEDGARVMVCVPHTGGGDPEDVDPDPPESDQTQP